MTLADDMRPEATLLIGLSQYALQRQSRILYELTRRNLRWHSISWSPIKSMTQATQPQGEALICDKHCEPGLVDVPTIVQMDCKMSKFKFHLDIPHNA